MTLPHLNIFKSKRDQSNKEISKLFKIKVDEAARNRPKRPKYTAEELEIKQMLKDIDTKKKNSSPS